MSLSCSENGRLFQVWRFPISSKRAKLVKITRSLETPVRYSGSGTASNYIAFAPKAATPEFLETCGFFFENTGYRRSISELTQDKAIRSVVVLYATDFTTFLTPYLGPILLAS
ncbi:hypothetical protein BJ508DRAFT_300615 [Ascobolus immersus RN42]|uniref:Uncharacterized protein n=1 Tax=Ascobolus immersus RN42 TaxID=1160509 RepID=A0A3N4IPY7_ASCIM|nr:hypothetical protein BJ508DRAFT_300615 [Ascobolus immersus RN42]